MKRLYVILPLLACFLLPSFPNVSTHGICNGLQYRYVRFDDAGLAANYRETGQSVSINGNIVSLTSEDLKGKLLLYSTPGPTGRWLVTSASHQSGDHTPTSATFDIPGNSVIRFSITAKALLPGHYYLSPELVLDGIGPITMLNGCPVEPNMEVVGSPICSKNLVPITSARDGSYACVMPDTYKKLQERGWAGESLMAVIYPWFSGSQYGNGTWNASYIIDVNVKGTDKESLPLTFQTFTKNGTLYKSDNIPASSIPANGFYKYNVTIGSDSYNMNDRFNLTITYGNLTKTISLLPGPPHL